MFVFRNASRLLFLGYLFLIPFFARPWIAKAAQNPDCNKNLVRGVQVAMDPAEQQKALWDHILASKYNRLPTKGPGALESLKLFSAAFLRETFLRSSDEMPAGRPKLIHTFGSVAKVDLEITNPAYSGVFTSGGLGLVRLSLAKMGDPFTPGMGVKIFINGQPSVNLIAMPSLDGQGFNHSFFAKTFTNILDAPLRFELKALAHAFANALSTFKNSLVNERSLPLGLASSVTDQGVAIDSPVVPAQIYFVPTFDVQQLPYSNADFRQGLAAIPSGTVLFRVMLRGNGATATPEEIGLLRTQSEFVASQYGDQNLFFQHAVQ